jgi:hypothetical protein
MLCSSDRISCEYSELNVSEVCKIVTIVRLGIMNLFKERSSLKTVVHSMDGITRVYTVYRWKTCHFYSTNVLTCLGAIAICWYCSFFCSSNDPWIVHCIQCTRGFQTVWRDPPVGRCWSSGGGGGELFVWGTYLFWTKCGREVKYIPW